MNKIYYTRFDLIAKYLYIKYRHLDTNFFRILYEKHIQTMNNCWEYPGTKTCIDDFYKDFDFLIENMEKKGFDKNNYIELGTNNVIINGSHRLITSYFLNIEPILKYKISEGSMSYNFDFFINRMNYQTYHKDIHKKGDCMNLNRLYSDTMALEFTKLDKNMRVMVTYPNINNKWDILENIIKNYGYLYYRKSVKLNDNGLNNLIKELYRNETWIGGLFPNGINPGGKYNICKGINPINIYLIHIYDLDKLIELKDKCRELYNLGKHSLHMSDYSEDTFRITSSLLNENSIDFLNNGTNDLSEKTKNTLEKYFNELKDNNEEYCVTSSVIMEMYGLRNAKDIDYLHKNDNILNIENIENHNGIWLSYYTKTKDDIIYNPENHFYFNGFKFVSLNILREMKKKRNEIKDQNDLQLIMNVKYIYF